MLVTKLDRLARSTRDLLNTLAAISEAGASFKSLGDSWADTTTPHGRLMLTVLGGLAEFERYLILSRTAEGRSRPRSRGIKFGRKPKLTKHQQAEARARLAQGETLVEIARSYNVSHMTISRLAGVTFCNSARQTSQISAPRPLAICEAVPIASLSSTHSTTSAAPKKLPSRPTI